MLLLIANALHAQSPRTTYTRNLVWGIASIDYKFNSHWSVTLDNQFRYEYTDGDIFMWLVRPSVSYKFKSGITATVGSSYFSLYPNPNGLIPRPEFRHWQELGWKFESKSRIHSIHPRVRFEQRVIREYEGSGLADEFTLNSVRFRVRVDYTYKCNPLEAKGLLLFTGNEVFFLRKPDGYTGFDQNRAWAGVGYRFSKAVTVQLSYMHWYQQRNSSTFDRNNIIRIAFQFQLEKQKKSE